ncbi:MAG TPA: prepilin-type N-terminal cleavage/methylation domain-containing protein [Candidatus Acidoferrum sp.]|nr:prepilin-type N-terminal cleavage/methylation domain-containing protein [Candidatus Acidoferrum sp.]
MMRGEHIVRYLGRSGGPSGGFSLIELLVTVVLILVLTTLYWSPNKASRQHGLQASCQKNLQKAYIALEIFANDSGGKFPQIKGAKISEEALDALVPKYTSDTSVFICPGSKDSLLGPGETLRSRRISYAYYMGRCLTNSTVLMSDKQVDTRAKAAGDTAFSTTGKPPGNNHRQYGGNFLFCDGHVELTPPTVPFALNVGAGEVLLNP